MNEIEAPARFLTLPDGRLSKTNQTTEIFTTGLSAGRCAQITEVQPSNQHTIFTEDLAGCISIALVARDQDGGSRLHLSLHGPTLHDSQKQSFREEFRALGRLGRAGAEISILISSPGQWVKSSDGRYKVVPHDPDIVQHVESAALGGFDDRSNVEIRVISYLKERQYKRHVGLIIDMPSSPWEPFRYDLQSTTYGSFEPRHRTVLAA